ncbi:MAG: DUF1080 domain-containing protein, partial [Planctomycetaceae bacterium]
LTGWAVHGATDGIEAAGGVLSIRSTLETRGGWLATKAEFDDFELSLEYRLEPEGDSGILLHIPDEGRKGGGDFCEIALLDDDAPMYAWTNEKTWAKTGAVFGVQGPDQFVTRPQGTWHQLNVIASGPDITVSIDGTLVNRVNVDTAPYLATGVRPFLKNRRGHIGLNRPGDAQFRNIRIRRLNERVEVERRGADASQSQSILYVKSDATPGGNGRSWETAFTDLQQALATAREARDGLDAIWIANGTYLPSKSGDPDQSFEFVDGIDIYGGFRGTETRIDQRTPKPSQTILSGDLKRDDGPSFQNRSDNSHRVVSAVLNDHTVIDSITITSGGQSATGPPQKYGAGMIIQGKADLKNVTVTGCQGYSGGGLLIASESLLTVTDCAFRGNAAKLGAGVASHSTDTRFIDCIFEQNSSIDDGGGLALGGYTINPAYSTVLRRCRFLGNTANGEGGGVAIRDHQVEGHSGERSYVFLQCEFRENQSTAGPGTGGSLGGALGVRGNRGAAVELLNCRFERNQSRADNSGAAIAISGKVAATGCLFAENSSADGSVFQISPYSTLILSFCTVASNDCSQQFLLADHATAKLEDAILQWASNSSLTTGSGHAGVTATNCCLSQKLQGQGNISGSPMFVTRGATRFALSDSSPCRNRGTLSQLPDDRFDLDDDKSVKEKLPVDVYGNPRVSSENPSLGAVE